MKKVLLIRPNPGKAIYASIPPLGLAYVVTGLRRIGCEPELWDLALGKREAAAFRRHAEAGIDADVIGIQTYSRDIEQTRLFMDELAPKLRDDAIVVLGGPHATVATEHALTYLDRANYAIVGEADRAFPALAQQLDGGGTLDPASIPGLAWLEDGRLNVNPQDFPDDVDALGPPAWDLIPPDRYHAETLGGFVKRVPAAVIVTGRGCPFHCAFCSARSIDGHKVRKHSIPHVMAEIRMLYEKYGIREIKIIDDNFTINRKYVLDFCTALRESGMDLVISMPCGVHATTLDEEVLAALQSVGAYNIPVALESGSQRVVDLMRKGLDLEEASRRIRLAASMGFEVTAFFIIGYPGETLDDLRKTIKISLDLPLTRAHFNAFCPFPGTEAYEMLRREGKIDESAPWHLQHMETVNYSFSDDLSRTQLNLWRVWALLRFYVFRPTYGLKLVAQVRSWKQFSFLLKKGLEFTGVWRVLEFLDSVRVGLLKRARQGP